jgi:cytosine/uracil/thiamine/allantoin permease
MLSDKTLFSQYVQIIIIPVAFTLAGFCGMAVASASEVLYGSVIWDPLQLIDRWDSRAASFFAAFSFALASKLIGNHAFDASESSSELQPSEQTFLLTV